MGAELGGGALEADSFEREDRVVQWRGGALYWTGGIWLWKHVCSRRSDATVSAVDTCGSSTALKRHRGMGLDA